MEKSLLHRREAIILTSVDVINEFGIQGLSTREVARRQGVSEGTIFKHFHTKNELMLAILDHYSQFDADIAESIKLKNLMPIDAITYFINAYAEYYQSYPQITAITQAYDVLSCDQKLTDKVKRIYLNRFEFIQSIIVEAQLLGCISKKIDSEKLSHIILGSFNDVCLKWRLSNYDFPLKDYIMSTIKTILDAFVNLN
jgi:AcrR family transcriptional regulator